MEQIKAMLEAMSKDAALNEEAGKLMEKGSIEEFVSAMAKKGFVFTKADWEAFKSTGKSKEELTEDSLQTVVGGSIWDGTYFQPIQGRCMAHLADSKSEWKHGEFRYWCSRVSCRVFETSQWWACRCHGTDKCVDKWHSSALCRD